MSKERDNATEAEGIGKMRGEGAIEIVIDKESLDTRIKRMSKVVDASKENSPSRVAAINNKKRGKDCS